VDISLSASKCFGSALLSLKEFSTNPRHFPIIQEHEFSQLWKTPGFSREAHEILVEMVKKFHLVFPVDFNCSDRSYWIVPSRLQSVHEYKEVDYCKFFKIHFSKSLNRNSNRVGCIYQFPVGIPSPFFGLLIGKLFGSEQKKQPLGSSFFRKMVWSDAILMETPAPFGEMKAAAIHLYNFKTQEQQQQQCFSFASILEVQCNGMESPMLMETICSEIESLIAEWYPGIAYRTHIVCRCISCARLSSKDLHKAIVSSPALCPVMSTSQFHRNQHFIPYLWDLDELYKSNETNLKCPFNKETPIEIPVQTLLPGGSSISLDEIYLFSPEQVSIPSEAGLITGEFASIYKGFLRSKEKKKEEENQEKEIIVKKFDIPMEEWILLSTVNTLSKLHHKNILKFIGVCTDSKNQLLVMEYMDFKTLKLLLSNENFGHPPIPFENRVRIALEVAEAMNFLHTNSIIHWALSTSNILVDNITYHPKLFNFGWISVFKPFPWENDEDSKENKMVPESFDISNYGLVIWKLFTNRNLSSASADPKVVPIMSTLDSIIKSCNRENIKFKGILEILRPLCEKYLE